VGEEYLTEPLTKVSQ